MTNETVDYYTYADCDERRLAAEAKLKALQESTAPRIHGNGQGEYCEAS